MRSKDDGDFGFIVISTHVHLAINLNRALEVYVQLCIAPSQYRGVIFEKFPLKR
jgi:sulfur relay (sulfurtransferase) complex TusBCD TusD component (DsrE family)